MPISVDALVSPLNAEQQAAVRQTEGPVLVLAGAGSGKTRVITTRIAYLIGKRRARPGEILAMTFTNKAAEEMRERVGRLVGAAAAKEIVLSTFHSFCARVLRAEIEHIGYRRNFTISTESDSRTLLRRSLEDLDGVRETFDAGIFLGQIGMMKNGRADAKPAAGAEPETESMQKYREWLPEIYELYQSALRAANSVDFDDLLALTLRLWREHPRILARYQERFAYVMVDEYQDTNRVQYDLLRMLVEKRRNLCVVGDDDQSIYSWRGAEIGNILCFERDFPEAKVVKLEQNYRSTETILAAANSVIRNNVKRRSKNLWSRLGQGARIDRFITGNEEHEAAEAVTWLTAIRAQTGASFEDFAVLYRSNVQSRPFELAFRQAQIPYQVFGGQDFFERAEIKDIVAYLKVLMNPRDEASFLRIVNVPRRGIGDATLHQVHEVCRRERVSFAEGLSQVLKSGSLQPNTEAGIRQLLGVLSRYRKQFKESGGQLSAIAQDLVREIGYRAELSRTCVSSEQMQARWSNVEALFQAMSAHESAARESGEGAPTLAGFLDQSSLAGDEGRDRNKDRHATGVSLMTIHSAKGLEYPFVFIAGLEEGLLPHEKSVGAEAIEEERRLFYVALTRGKRHVTLLEALSRDRYGRSRLSTPSRFVREIPAELIHEHVRAAKDMVEAHVNTSGQAKDAASKRTASKRAAAKRKRSKAPRGQA